MQPVLYSIADCTVDFRHVIRVSKPVFVDDNYSNPLRLDSWCKNAYGYFNIWFSDGKRIQVEVKPHKYVRGLADYPEREQLNKVRDKIMKDLELQHKKVLFVWSQVVNSGNEIIPIEYL
jgi:hypothetical protein